MNSLEYRDGVPWVAEQGHIYKELKKECYVVIVLYHHYTKCCQSNHFVGLDMTMNIKYPSKYLFHLLFVHQSHE